MRHFGRVAGSWHYRPQQERANRVAGRANVLQAIQWAAGLVLW